MRKNKICGFSLLELLVALSLMIIIVGATVTIFMGASKILNTTEEKMFIFQNARAAFDIISKDLRNAQDVDQFLLTIQNPVDTTSPQLLMKFLTTTSWVNSNDDTGNIITGETRIYYYLEKRNNKWNLKRHLVESNEKAGAFAQDPPDPINKSFDRTLTNDIMCQFINEANVSGTVLPSFSIDYFFFDTNDPQNLLVEKPVGSFVFDSSSDAPEKKFPFALRINIDITDDSQSTIRTFSKTIRLLPSQN